MGVITPGKFRGDDRFRSLHEERRMIHCLREPTGFHCGLVWHSVGYQMQYSVHVLESQLEEEGNPHVLQLNLNWIDDNWKNPTEWRLLADGREVANGNGTFARQCFEDSAERFRDVCRDAVMAANLPDIDQHDYEILKCARAIAAGEPYDSGSRELGGQPHRVYL